MIISISGKAGSGKDTVGQIIQYLKMYNGNPTIPFNEWIMWCEQLHTKLGAVAVEFVIGWQIKKWAGPLRKVAAILLRMDEEFLYTEEFKQKVLPECWNTFRPTAAIASNIEVGMTGREFLQKLGTDVIRNELHENTWVNSLMSEYKPMQIGKYGIAEMIEDESLVNLIEYPNWIITDTRFPNELAAVKERKGITIKVVRSSSADDDSHPSETALDDAQFDYTIYNDGSIQELIEKVRQVLNDFVKF